MKEKSLNNDLQKDSDQSNQKSSKKEKKKFLKKYLRSTRDNLKTERRKSSKRNDSLLASSQIMQVKIISRKYFMYIKLLIIAVQSNLSNIRRFI